MMADLEPSNVIVAAGAENLEFRRAAHVKYLKAMLDVMPAPYLSLDTSRLTALYFCLAGLDILGEIDSVDKAQTIEFIYSLQLCGNKYSVNSSGFIGGNFANHSLCGECTTNSSTFRSQSQRNVCLDCSLFGNTDVHMQFHQGHIAMTYTALASLITLGDDLSRVNKAAIISGKNFSNKNNTPTVRLFKTHVWCWARL